MEKFDFQKNFFKGGTLWRRNGQKTFFWFFKFSKFFFEKWPQWDVSNVERNKVMKYELNQSVHWGVTWDIPPGGSAGPPPQCRIGLKSWHIETYHERREELKCAICQKSICQKRRPQKRQFKKNLWLSGRNKKLKKLIMLSLRKKNFKC